MSAEILVVRGFLRANPTVTDIPVVVNLARNNLTAEGHLLWPNKDDAIVFGSMSYRCDLPNLADLFKNVDLRFPVWKPKTHRDIAKIVFDALGVAVKVDDIEPTAMSYDPLPNTVTLQALPTATTAKGSVVVNIYQKTMDIAEIITTTEVVGVVDNYPLTNPQMVLEKKYYGYDFTSDRDVLKSTAKPGAILNIQTVYDEMYAPAWGSSWDRPQAYNLYNVRRTYVGPTSGYPEANPAYTHCAVFMPWTMSSNTAPYSCMILHFDQ